MRHDLLALIFGILGLILIWVPFLGVALAVLAIVFYAVNKKHTGGSGLATAGLVLGIIAILGQVFVMVGLLALFGVFDVQSFVPDRCMIAGGFNCEDYGVTGNDVSLAIRNGVGQDVTVNEIRLVKDSGEFCLQTGKDIPNQGRAVFDIPCKLEDKNRFEVMIKYTQAGVEKNVVGDLMISK